MMTRSPVGMTPIAYTDKEGGFFKSWTSGKITALTLHDPSSRLFLVDTDRDLGHVAYALFFTQGHSRPLIAWEVLTGWRELDSEK